MMPLGADKVIAKGGLVFNPHYKAMGLFGSEYWTYSLPKRVGNAMAAKLTESCLPISAEAAQECGLVDDVFEGRSYDVLRMALGEARSMALRSVDLLAKKAHERNADEAAKPLQTYRDEELFHMHNNFYKDSLGFAEKRAAFVQKKKLEQAPVRIAKHRIAKTIQKSASPIRSPRA
jgi:putative two-component system hydrogenase maturation factor HypX/HoxX